MATKKKAVKALPEPVVVEIDVKALHDWAYESLSAAKAYKAGATTSEQRVALDNLLVRLRAVLAVSEAK